MIDDDYEEYFDDGSEHDEEGLSNLLDTIIHDGFDVNDTGTWLEEDWLMFVHQALDSIWAPWQRCGQGVYIGFPSMDIIQKAREGGWSPGLRIYPDNEPAEYLDALICMLTKRQIQSLIAEYIGRASGRTAARILKIDESTYREHINAACRNLVKMLKKNNPYHREMLEKIFT